jgi:hypothetical protein
VEPDTGFGALVPGVSHIAAYRDAAARAFAHGYHLAVGAGAICVLAAAVTAVLGFRRPS